MYGQHPSKELNRLYQQRPYQGQDPELAQIIFLGLDANFKEDIDKDREQFKFTKEYLEDGVQFWETHKVHHPFIRQKEYKDGVRYHKNFAKLHLNTTYAKNISFVELLDIPTVGKTGANRKEFYKLLNIDYLKNVENIILNPRNKKVIFLSGSVLNALIHIKNQFKQFELFKWLPTKRIKGGNKAHRIFENDAVCIYQVFHFSASITDDHIKEIRGIIDEFEDITDHYNNSVQLALGVCIKIIEDLSKATDVRMYTWLKYPGNYYMTLYPGEIMDVYKPNNIENENKIVDRKISSFSNIPSGEDFGTTIGLYGNDCMMIPGWCNGGDINFFQRYKENNNFQEVYDLVYKSLNIAQFQKYSKCKIFDNSKHLSLLREVLNTITHFENISFEIPCVDTPFPYETVRFSDFAEDICEYDLREPETR